MVAYDFTWNFIQSMHLSYKHLKCHEEKTSRKYIYYFEKSSTLFNIYDVFVPSPLSVWSLVCRLWECGSLSSGIPIRYRQCLCHCSFTSFRANPRPSSRLRLSLNTLLIAVPFDSRVWITLLPTWTPREDKETTRITNPNPRLRDRFHRVRSAAKAWR